MDEAGPITSLRWSIARRRDDGWRRLPRASLCAEDGSTIVSVVALRRDGSAPFTYVLRLGGTMIEPLDQEADGIANFSSAEAELPAEGAVAVTLRFKTATVCITSEADDVVVRMTSVADPELWREYRLFRRPVAREKEGLRPAQLASPKLLRQLPGRPRVPVWARGEVLEGLR
jgi:hypothetical protein